jgi:hypothetical protein
VNQHDRQVGQAEHRAAVGERLRQSESHDEKAGHPAEQRQAPAETVKRD